MRDDVSGLCRQPLIEVQCACLDQHCFGLIFGVSNNVGDHWIAVTNCSQSGNNHVHVTDMYTRIMCVLCRSVGAAPVPSAGLVTMITVWQTAFPEYDVPSAISYVQVRLFGYMYIVY